MLNIFVWMFHCIHAPSSLYTLQMGVVAPNLAALIGDTVGARLISKAGSLTSLAKCPASTVQILGAEKVSTASSLKHLYSGPLRMAKPLRGEMSIT